MKDTENMETQENLVRGIKKERPIIMGIMEICTHHLYLNFVF